MHTSYEIKYIKLYIVKSKIYIRNYKKIIYLIINVKNNIKND